MQATDTAHATWNETWQSHAGRAPWLTPDAGVMKAILSLAARGEVVKAADIGCGVGRHALAMARAGFTVTALDASPVGLEECRRQAEAEGLAIQTLEGRMNALPFADASLDYLLSFNVIYHGDAKVVRETFAEIARVLKPGGLFQGTMLSKRNGGYGIGREVAENTFVQDDATDDKIHPHFYCNAPELLALLEGFEIWRLEDNEHKGAGSRSWHWHFEAQRL